MRILDVEEIKTVPYTPTLHAFVERLIGTIRREHIDRLFFWNECDLERKLKQFKTYYNDERVYSSLDRNTPTNKEVAEIISIDNYRWKSYARDLFQLLMAA